MDLRKIILIKLKMNWKCMHWRTGSALVQIISTPSPPLLEQLLTNCQLSAYQQTSAKFESKIQKFSLKKLFENAVCEMVAILSKGRWVKSKFISVTLLMSLRMKYILFCAICMCIYNYIHWSDSAQTQVYVYMYIHSCDYIPQNCHRIECWILHIPLNHYNVLCK